MSVGEVNLLGNSLAGDRKPFAKVLRVQDSLKGKAKVASIAAANVTANSGRGILLDIAAQHITLGTFAPGGAFVARDNSIVGGPLV